MNGRNFSLLIKSSQLQGYSGLIIGRQSWRMVADLPRKPAAVTAFFIAQFLMGRGSSQCRDCGEGPKV